MNYQPSPIGSVTGWIRDLRENDEDARTKIWQRFVDRLVLLADRKLSGGVCRVVDGEDIATMAFANFFENGPEHFARLANRNDLWQILALLTERRAIDQIRKESAQKKGGGKTVSESVLSGSDSERNFGLDGFPGNTPRPDVEILLAEEFGARLESLEDDNLGKVAIERMQGYSNFEIALRLTMSLRSVERKLKLIRDIFKADLES